MDPERIQLAQLIAFRIFFFSSRRRHTRCGRDWSSDVCSSDLPSTRRFKKSAKLERNTTVHVSLEDFLNLLVDGHGQGHSAQPSSHILVLLLLHLLLSRQKERLSATEMRSEERRVGKECRSRWS